MAMLSRIIANFANYGNNVETYPRSTGSGTGCPQ